ncbi:hypothetical protein Goshw_016121, partial [Gossypium schwendimanii]|nr:hypothetical protein [Gossypium schwendimanii]
KNHVQTLRSVPPIADQSLAGFCLDVKFRCHHQCIMLLATAARKLKATNAMCNAAIHSDGRRSDPTPELAGFWVWFGFSFKEMEKSKIFWAHHKNDMTHISTPTILKEETILILVIEPTSFKYITQIHFSDYKLVDALYKFDANSNGELINFEFEDRFGKLNFSSFPNLILLNLSNSELHENIPPQIGDLSTLKYLNLSHCWLHGELPPLGTLSQLEFLDISDNLINGSIPPQLGNHASLNLRYQKLNFCLT